MNTSRATHTLLWLAVLLVIAWAVLRVALSVTALGLHLLWIAGIVLFVMWLVGLMRGRGRPV
jgi:hypothetical protein